MPNAGSTDPVLPGDVADLRRRLLAWYDREARPLPWRERPSLYGVWVSEIMLQQTTVAAVTERWTAFLRRFPDADALAAASETDVLDAWAGLGYYRRARRLHEAARLVAAEHGGRLPRTRAGWRALPGVGDYTAGAVTSIGLGLPEAAVDTNVARVLTRLACAGPDEAAGLRPAKLRALAAASLDPARPGDWNQALMDLGAGVCTPGEPACGRCPLASSCRARGGGAAAELPPPAARRVPKEVVWSLLVLTDGARLLTAPDRLAAETTVAGLGEVIRDDLRGLYRGYDGLPVSRWQAPGGGDDVEARCVEAWRAWFEERGGVWLKPPSAVGRFRHGITSHRLVAVVVAGVTDARTFTDLQRDGFAARPLADRVRLAPPARRACRLALDDPKI